MERFDDRVMKSVRIESVMPEDDTFEEVEEYK